MKNKELIVDVLVISLIIGLVGIFNLIDRRIYNVKETKETISNIEVSYVENETPEEVPLETIEEPIEEDPIVYEGLTMQQLVDKLDKYLKSDLSGTGYLFAKYSLQYGVDPVMAVAISLHETGCGSRCSAQVADCNNVGGQKFKPVCYAGGTYGKYDTLERGIEGFIRNIANNYVALGLNTPELMQAKYVGTGSTTWAPQVNNYMRKIKSA